MTHLLSVEGLRVEYRSRTAATVAVDDVSLTVSTGETVALVGESGSGKTTLSSAVMSLLAPGARVTAGRVRIEGRDVVTMPETERRSLRGRRVALVPQDPRASLDPLVRVGDQIAEVLEVHGVAHGTAALERAIQLLEQVRIPDARRRSRQYPHEFSGGMLQRVLIAMAVCCDPALIVADEPTSGLDPTVQRAIMDQLGELSRDHRAGILLITHDLALALERADRIAVMHRGAIVETGTAADVFDHPAHEYTRRLLAARPAASRRSSRPVSPRDPLLVVDGLTVRYPGRDSREALPLAVDDVSFSVERGSTLAIVGESGSGKSTIANVLLGLVPVTEGRVLLDGRDIGGLRRREWREVRRNLQPVFQSPYTALDPRLRVGAAIEEPLRVFERRGDVRRARVAEVHAEVGLPPEFLTKRPGQLSGGQRQRVAIARAVASSPGLIVLDEPTSALDALTQANVLELLRTMQRERGLTYVFVSHDLAVVRSLADAVVVLRAGRVVESGPAAVVFRAPTQPYTRELLNASLGARASVEEGADGSADPAEPAH